MGDTFFVSKSDYFRTGYRRLADTLHRIRSFKELTKFLVAYLIYNDAIETVIVMASIFGAEVLGMKTDEIILFGLMVQGIAFIGSLVFGYLADAVGSKRTVMVSLIVWSVIVLWAFRLGIFWAPKAEYWILGDSSGWSWAEARLPPDPFRGS